MSYRFSETKTWQLGVKKLNPNARVSLLFALDRILGDPHDSYRRRQRRDGATFDYAAAGLLIAYRMIEPDVVLLLDVVDVKKEHGWPGN